MDDDDLDLALWKLSVLGPLVSARLEHGDRLAWLRETAERVHQRPDGRLVTLSPHTLEAWLYAYRKDGLSALARRTRRDRGTSRAIAQEVEDLLVRAKRERPRRSIRRLIRMLERARVVRPGELSRSSVHRLLASQGLSTRPARGPSAERRSFLVEHAGDLWIGDADARAGGHRPDTNGCAAPSHGWSTSPASACSSERRAWARRPRCATSAPSSQSPTTG